MNTDLPVRGHRLGWIRVAVRLAVGGVPPDGDAINAWLRREGLTWESLGRSTGGDPARMALALGFLDEGLNPTDRGHALDRAATRYEPGGSLFSHGITTRWILWRATAATEPAWWRAALAAWSPSIKQFDWLLAAARDLHARGIAGRMEAVIRGADEGPPQARGGLSMRWGNPWLRQVDDLGWVDALPRLSPWARTTPDALGDADIWAAFCVAEGLDGSPAADLDDLRATLADLPRSLRGLDGREAAEATVRLWGAARSLGEGAPRCWYGEPWESLLADARAAGVRRKAGATTRDPNLAWTAEALRADDAETGGPADPPPPDPPPPDPPPPGGPPPPLVGPPPADPQTHRARAVLRALAWWCRGRSAGDLLTAGHDSWSTFRWTLGTWLRPDESKRWAGRCKPFVVLPPDDRQASWIRETAGAFRAGMAHPLLNVFAAEHRRELSFDMLCEAGARLPAAIAPPVQVEQWLADDEDRPGWPDVEAALIQWAASGVERDLWTVDDLRLALQDAEEGTADDVRRLIDILSQARADALYLVDGKLITSGALPDALPGGLFLHDGVPPFDAVRFSIEVRAASAAAAFGVAVREAAGRLAACAPASKIFPPSQPDAITEVLVGPDDADPEYRPVPLHPIEAPADEAGYAAWWGTRAWFEPRPAPALAWPTETERREFGGSRRQLTPVDRLFGLWVTLESIFEDGQDGRSVIERVSLSAIPAVARALRADAIEAARLVGVQHPGEGATWQAWADWAPRTDCPWAEARFARLGSALGAHAGLLTTARGAVAHAFWLLSVLFAVRNRRAHEAWQPEPGDGVMLERLDGALGRLLAALLDARGDRPAWSVAGRFVNLLGAQAPPALLDALGV